MHYSENKVYEFSRQGVGSCDCYLMVLACLAAKTKTKIEKEKGGIGFTRPTFSSYFD